MGTAPSRTRRIEVSSTVQDARAAMRKKDIESMVFSRRIHDVHSVECRTSADITLSNGKSIHFSGGNTL